MSDPIWKYRLSEIQLGPEEEEAVLAVVRSGWLSMGSESEALEREFGAFIGSPHVLAVSNATAGLHLALLAVGAGPGDEVIVPSMSFVATANAVLYCGARPVFADIESLERPLIDPADIERKLTPRTRAVIVMHYGGYPCRMDEILELSRRRGVRVVEDAAHCAGSRVNDRACGTIGDVGVFSLFGNKNIPAGEGGLVVARDADLLQAMRLRRSHGMTSVSWDRARGRATGYEVVELGYNYRMPELSSAVARRQLAKAPAQNLERDRVFRDYLDSLAGAPDLVIPFATTRDASPGSRHLFVVLARDAADRESRSARLRDAGIQSSVHYPPIHAFAHYRRQPGGAGIRLERTEEFATRVLTLPFHAGLEASDVELITGTLRGPGKGPKNSKENA